IQRVSAPLVLESYTGLNDTLSTSTKAVSFDLPITNQQVEVVQSLAKWKRMALYKYEIPLNHGIYADMNAIRPNISPSALYSIYFDQWDWEVTISSEERSREILESFVKKIYQTLKDTENYITKEYPRLSKKLPDDIYFITTQELENMYPNLSPKERELKIVQIAKAVFIIGIGHTLKSGQAHAERAPDYDDWNLNGDMIFYHEALDAVLGVCVMGVRVNKEILDQQLQIVQEEERRNQDFHKMIFAELLPQSIGGGIGQSRLAMFFLEKIHIGEVQVSVWTEDMVKYCAINRIFLL
ncbi:MAG: aspartate--ammonia ligase, partial [Brevinema sp.]